MSKIGYVRVSSKTQHLDRQIDALKGVKKVFVDKLSGRTLERPQLTAMLDYIREGDIVVVTELERLGRNNKELTDTIQLIQKNGATLDVLNLPTLQGIEDDNLRRLINNLIIEIYKYQAEQDVKMIRERQRQGIAIAKAKGKFKGGKPKYKEDDPKLQHAFALYINGMTDSDVERVTGINRRTFKRYREKYNIERKL